MMGSVANLADRGLNLGIGIPWHSQDIPWHSRDMRGGLPTRQLLREEKQKREGLDQIFDEKDASSNEYAGVNLLTLEHERTLRNLIKLIRRFEAEGFTFGRDEEIKCDAASAEAASAFLRALPTEYGLPKIAPDGEGGVILAWESAQCELVMSICGWTLYPVINPSSDSEHLRSLNFDGERIPDQILSHLPAN